MRWEVFFNEETATVTVIDAPEGHQFEMPPNVGASIGELTTEPGAKFIMSRNDSLIKTWLTDRFAILGIETPIQQFVHLPML